MTISKSVGLRGLRYRGGGPMWAWILHRISGLGMIVFVSIHVVASFMMQQFGSDIGTAINVVYESVYFQVFIYFVVIWHALNGTRIIMMDVWPKLLDYQREVTWAQWLIFIPLYGLVVFIMIQRALSGG